MQKFILHWGEMDTRWGINRTRECIADMNKANGSDYQKQRLQDMLEFFEAGTACFDDVNRLSPSALRKIGKLSGKVTKLLGIWS
jgi:DNA-binding transcriptional regulator GbsR (MarR family)